MFSISAYKLNTYDTCAFKYKCVYIDKVADKYAVARPYLTMGAHIHNALKDYYDMLKENERNKDAIEKRLRERWTENRTGFIDKSDENKWGNKALQMVRVFEASPYSKIQPVFLEDYCDVAVGEEFKIIGRIDRADKEKEGLHVIDYKTGKSDGEKNNLQLLLYAFIIQNYFRAEVKKASYWYLYDNTFHTIEPTEDEMEAVVEKLGEKVKLMQAEKEFAPKINQFCKNCDFLPICPKKEKIENS